MAKLKINECEIESLEKKADLAYHILKIGLKNSDPIIIESAEVLYSEDLENYLNHLTTSCTENIRHLRKGGKRTEKIEKFILQCVIMNYVSLTKGDNKFKLSINEDPDDKMGGLRVYIDANEDSPELFKRIQEKALKLRKEKKYDSILNALEYVREKYQF